MPLEDGQINTAAYFYRFLVATSHGSSASWFWDCLAGDRLAGSGALRVNEHLQVEGCSHIYAIGDCANVREPKMAYHAGLHASVAVANIINSVKQRPLKTYKPGQEAPSVALL